MPRWGCVASAIGQKRKFSPRAHVVRFAPESRNSRAISASPLGANNGHVAFDISRLKTGPAASLTLNFLVTFFEKTFAFAILAFHFWLAGILLHVLSKSNAVGNPRQRP
jgi:hypothetical protein